MIDYELVEKYLDVARSAVNTEGLCNLEDITYRGILNLTGLFKRVLKEARRESMLMRNIWNTFLVTLKT